MRHTLLPSYERRLLRFEYHVRLAVVLFLSLSATLFVGVVSLFPAYIYGSFGEKTQIEATASLKKNSDSNGRSSMEKALSADSIILGNLSTVSENMRVSMAVTKVLSLRGPIKISAISSIAISPSTVSMILKGHSPAREDLLAFKSRIESGLNGGKIDLPVSLLAKKSDINFSVNLTYSYP